MQFLEQSHKVTPSHLLLYQPTQRPAALCKAAAAGLDLILQVIEKMPDTFSAGRLPAEYGPHGQDG